MKNMQKVAGIILTMALLIMAGCGDVRNASGKVPEEGLP